MSLASVFKGFWQVWKQGGVPQSRGAEDYEREDHTPSGGEIRIAGSYKEIAWVFSAIRKLAWSASRVPVVMKHQATMSDASEEKQETLKDHEALALIEDPNEHGGWPSIVEASVWNLMLYGSAYIEKAHPPGNFKQVEGLYPLRSNVMTVEGDKKKLVKRFVYRPNFRDIFFEREEIVWIKFYDPESDLSGFAPILAASGAVTIDKDAQLRAMHSLRNDSTPGMILSIPGDQLKQRELNRIYAQFDKRHKGPKKTNRPLVVGGDAKVTMGGTTPRELQVSETRRTNRDEILSVMDVPPVKAGVMENASFANAHEQNRHFWHEAVVPILTLFYDALNRQWIWPQYGRDVWLEPDLREVLLDSEERDRRKADAISLWGSDLITKNEAREKIGMSPVDDGEKFKSESVRIAPGFGGGMSSLFAASKAARPGTPLHKMKFEKDAKVVFWKGVNDVAEEFERRLSVIAAKILSGHKDVVLREFSNTFTKSAVSSGNGHVLIAKSEKRWFTKDEADAEELKAKAKEFERRIFELSKDEIDAEWPIMEQALKAVFMEAARNVEDNIGLDVGFDFTDPAVTKYLRSKRLRLAGDLSDTTLGKVKAVIADGIEASKSLDDVAQDLAAKFDDLEPSRSILIARTEAADASNFANVESYRQSGVIEKKEWMATPDDITRDDHAEADGQQVGLSGSFSVGGESLRWPGDTANGSPGNTCNCRCAAAPVIE